MRGAGLAAVERTRMPDGCNLEVLATDLGGDYAFGDRRGGIMVLDESGAGPRWRPYASGLRNPAGFDWHPETGVRHATNDGPDHHGYEAPREYFVRDRVTGFQDPDTGARWARPAGVAVDPEGRVHFTSDAGMDARFRLRPDGDGTRPR